MGRIPNVNVMARLELELTYFEASQQYFRHDSTKTSFVHVRMRVIFI